METTTLHAPDIVCDGCADAIKKELAGVDGVKSVEVDVTAKTVTVTRDPNAASSIEDIAAALDRVGYPTKQTAS